MRDATRNDMPRLPARFAPLAYGIIQAAITTGLATAIATQQLTGLGAEFLVRWLLAWLAAWLAMLPVVALIAPLVHRAVVALTEHDRRPHAP